jgi:hypothetical protein
MASTRNKNTQGNYQSEQWSLDQTRNWIAYEHASNGRAIQTHLPGNGLLVGRVANTELSKNPADIESHLYGIGSTNLVTPYEQPTPLINQIPSLNIASKTPLFMPDPLIIEPNQRPRPL